MIQSIKEKALSIQKGSREFDSSGRQVENLDQTLEFPTNAAKGGGTNKDASGYKFGSKI